MLLSRGVVDLSSSQLLLEAGDLLVRSRDRHPPLDARAASRAPFRESISWRAVAVAASPDARRQAPFWSLDLLATAATSGELLLEARDLGAPAAAAVRSESSAVFQRRAASSRAVVAACSATMRAAFASSADFSAAATRSVASAPDVELAGAARAAASASSSWRACLRRSFRSLAACASSSRAAANVASPSLSAASACVARSSRSRTARFSSLRSAFARSSLASMFYFSVITSYGLFQQFPAHAVA